MRYKGAADLIKVDAFEVSVDLFTQMAPSCQRKLAEFDGDQTATAKAVFQGLLNKKWCIAEQSKWFMFQTARQLGWPLQENVLAEKSMTPALSWSDRRWINSPAE